MEDSILKSTKKILGLSEDYTIFDQDILTHINATFSILHQLGIGPSDGFYVEDAETEWAAFTLLPNTEVSLALIRTYVPLKVKMVFDPPGTSYLIESMQKQIDQYEWRLNVARECEVYELSQEVTP